MKTKTVDGFSRYLARSDGRIVSLCRKKPIVMAGGRDKDGYFQMTLVKDTGEYLNFRRAAFVCTAFHGPRPPGAVVRHLDGSKDNDVPENLAWGSFLENALDKATHGTMNRGETVGTSKLKEKDVRFIRDNPNISREEAAKMLGVCPYSVWCVRSRKTWKHLP